MEVDDMAVDDITVSRTAVEDATPDDAPVVRTRAGEVRGLWRVLADGTRSAAFLGVPYAQPPVGDLRFAPPQPVRAWTGVRDARRPGPTAQIAPLGSVQTIPEPSTPGDDVLNLTVFTPAPGDPDAALPVLVWIHGGGYVGGCQNSPWYDGAAFNRDGIVTVAIGYRLGVEGWLHVDGAPDNRGALDWLAGLTWVQENIAAFGGDPARVTVAGQSAGAGAVLTLLGMPGAAGLFQRAMAFSGALGHPRTRADAAHVAEEFSRVSGLPATATALQDVPRERLHADMLRLLDRPDGLISIPLAPFADGTAIVACADDAAAQGLGADVPLLLGFTRHEFDLAAQHLDPDLPPAQVQAALVHAGLRPELAERLAARGEPAGEVVGRTLTDGLFRSMNLAVADARAHRRAATDAAPTWLYEFTWASRAPQTAGHAFHCVDVPFGWDCFDRERVEAATGPEPPQDLADAYHGAWVRFVTGGDPGWPPYELPGRATRIWDTPATVANDPHRDLRATWLPDAATSPEEARATDEAEALATAT